MRGGSIQLNHFLLYQRELFSWIMKLVEDVYFADTRNLNGRKFWQFPVKKLGLVPRFAEILRKWLLARVAIKRMGRSDKGLTKYLTNKAIMVTDICYIEDFSLYSMTGKHFIVLQTVIRECLKDLGIRYNRLKNNLPHLLQIYAMHSCTGWHRWGHQQLLLCYSCEYLCGRGN